MKFENGVHGEHLIYVDSYEGIFLWEKKGQLSFPGGRKKPREDSFSCIERVLGNNLNLPKNSLSLGLFYTNALNTFDDSNFSFFTNFNFGYFTGSVNPAKEISAFGFFKNLDNLNLSPMTSLIIKYLKKDNYIENEKNKFFPPEAKNF